MSKVFISGSRHIPRLTRQVEERLQNIISQNIHIVIGDANGADKAVQKFLLEHNYDNVTIYCSGSYCRNNLGSWRVEYVQVEPELKGRAFYTVKDKKMAEVAEYGFALWDGKSQGTLNNIKELSQQQKPTLIYISPKKDFVVVKSLKELLELSVVNNKKASSTTTTQGQQLLWI
jgi:hypothetical protein